MSQRSEDAFLRWLKQQTDRFARLSLSYPIWLDLGLGAITVALSIVGLHAQNRLSLANVCFGVALCAPLPLRRRWPLAAFGLIALIAFAQWLISVPQLADAAVLYALYWVGRESPLAGVALASLVAEVGALMAALTWSPSEPVKVWVGLSGLAMAAVVLGVAVRERRALLGSLSERAARLELERDQEGRLGAAAERARIAREMHDIVSHNLTVMIALADGAGYAMESSPEQARPAIERVSATGRQALGEMRRLLGVLHEECSAQPFAPQPTLARLDELLARVEAAGVPVSIDLVGDPHALSDGVQLAVFRVAQEALTNTLQHAVTPTRAVLTLRCRAGNVELEVSDDGHAVAGAAAEGTAGLAGGGSAVGAGRGLPGLQERAAAYGGTLDAGPLPDGGWRVRLRIDADADAGALVR